MCRARQRILLERGGDCRDRDTGVCIRRTRIRIIHKCLKSTSFGLWLVCLAYPSLCPPPGPVEDRGFDSGDFCTGSKMAHAAVCLRSGPSRQAFFHLHYRLHKRFNASRATRGLQQKLLYLEPFVTHPSPGSCGVFANSAVAYHKEIQF